MWKNAKPGPLQPSILLENPIPKTRELHTNQKTITMSTNHESNNKTNQR